MTVDYAYQFIQFVARKNQAAQITPKEVQFALASGQKNYYEYLLGLVQQFQPGRPVPTVALGMNSKISTDLSPFKFEDVTIAVVTNKAPLPSKFRYLSLMLDQNGKQMQWMSDNKLPGRLASVIDPISETGKGFYNESNGAWRVYPDGTITSIKVNYYVKPDDIVWAYTFDANGRPVYNPIGSVDPQFNDEAMTDVLARALEILGWSFQSENLVEYGQEVKKNGG